MHYFYCYYFRSVQSLQFPCLPKAYSRLVSTFVTACLTSFQCLFTKFSTELSWPKCGASISLLLCLESIIKDGHHSGTTIPCVPMHGYMMSPAIYIYKVLHCIRVHPYLWYVLSFIQVHSLKKISLGNTITSAGFQKIPNVLLQLKGRLPSIDFTSRNGSWLKLINKPVYVDMRKRYII